MDGESALLLLTSHPPQSAATQKLASIGAAHRHILRATPCPATTSQSFRASMHRHTRQPSRADPSLFGRFPGSSFYPASMEVTVFFTDGETTGAVESFLRNWSLVSSCHCVRTVWGSASTSRPATSWSATRCRVLCTVLLQEKTRTGCTPAIGEQW